MRKNVVTWCAILFVTANFYAGKSQDLSSVSPANIDSILKKVELIPIMINGEKDNRINIVIMNRWTQRDKEPYNSREMRQEFLKDIDASLIAALTPGDTRAQTVFANYRQFFNVYGLWWPDMPEWGKGVDEKTVDALRDKLFLPWKDEYTGWVTFLVMPNSNSGGGGAARDLEKRFGTALIAGNGIGKMLHEISHTCMSIGDEYTTAATGTSAMTTYNSTTEYQRDKIKWRKWIETDTPLPTPYTKEYALKIGAFEGCQYHLTNYFRSTAQGCIMGAGIFDNTEKMCPICEQRVAMRVYKLVNPLKSVTPAETNVSINGPQEIHFAIDHIRPTPNTQLVRWVLNGKTIATGDDEINIKFGEIAKYELTCTLTDETPFIRPDPPYGKYPKMEVKWNITNSAPSSTNNELRVELQSLLQKDQLSGGKMIKPKVSGGKPPYTFTWSTGSSERDLKNVGPGIYDLVVTDSEYRIAHAHHAVYAGPVISGNKRLSSGNSPAISAVLKVEADVTASDNEKENGKISLSVKGGSEPYTIVWDDGINDYSADRIYEAENGSFTIPGTVVKTCSDAGNNAFVNFNDREGSATFKVEVAKEGLYPIGIVYGSIVRDKSQMNISVNGAAEKPVTFRGTLPMFTGWDKFTVMAWLKEGFNLITLSSSGHSLPNIDYLSIPGSFKTTPIQERQRINLHPGDYTVTVKDKNNNLITKTIAVPELYPFRVAKLDIMKSKPKTVQIMDPVPGYTYKWYNEDAPMFVLEDYENPLASGNEFTPPAPGNYYVAARNNLTNGESSNRICLAIGKTPVKEVKAVHPSELSEKDLLFWFDSSDLNGDGETDVIIPERGPQDWKEKSSRNPGKMFVKYEPNSLNGLGVGRFDQVWVGNIGKEVIGYQTIIMVYKESSLSLASTSPFKTLGKYIGKSVDSGQRLFDPEKTDEKTKNGNTYLNGKSVDPFITPNPMKFSILTVVLSAPAKDPIITTDGNWEASLAEMLVINKKLSDSEREGIEEYLRRKWLSSIDLDF